MGRVLTVQTSQQGAALRKVSKMNRFLSILTFILKNFGPLIVFYFANHIWGLKTAIAVSMGYAFVEWLQLWRTGQKATLFFRFSVAMTLIFGILDLSMDSAFFYKIEATVSNLFTAFFFSITLFQSKPLIQQFAEQQQRTSMEQSADKTYFFGILTMIWTIYFVAKAFVYLWTNFNLENEQGLLIRLVVGNVSFGILLAASIFLSRPFWNLLVKMKLLPSMRTRNDKDAV